MNDGVPGKGGGAAPHCDEGRDEDEDEDEDGGDNSSSAELAYRTPPGSRGMSPSAADDDTRQKANRYKSLATPTAEHFRAIKEAITLKGVDSVHNQDRGEETSNPGKGRGKRWTPDEHYRFLIALRELGDRRDWHEMQTILPTKSIAQIRTHTYSYLAKISRGEAHLESDLEHLQSMPGVNSSVYLRLLTERSTKYEEDRRAVDSEEDSALDSERESEGTDYSDSWSEDSDYDSDGCGNYYYHSRGEGGGGGGWGVRKRWSPSTSRDAHRARTTIARRKTYSQTKAEDRADAKALNDVASIMNSLKNDTSIVQSIGTRSDYPYLHHPHSSSMVQIRPTPVLAGARVGCPVPGLPSHHVPPVVTAPVRQVVSSLLPLPPQRQCGMASSKPPLEISVVGDNRIMTTSPAPSVGGMTETMTSGARSVYLLSTPLHHLNTSASRSQQQQQQQPLTSPGVARPPPLQHHHHHNTNSGLTKERLQKQYEPPRHNDLSFQPQQLYNDTASGSSMTWELTATVPPPPIAAEKQPEQQALLLQVVPGEREKEEKGETEKQSDEWEGH